VPRGCILISDSPLLIPASASISAISCDELRPVRLAGIAEAGAHRVDPLPAASCEVLVSAVLILAHSGASGPRRTQLRRLLMLDGGTNPEKLPGNVVGAAQKVASGRKIWSHYPSQKSANAPFGGAVIVSPAACCPPACCSALNRRRARRSTITKLNGLPEAGEPALETLNPGAARSLKKRHPR